MIASTALQRKNSQCLSSLDAYLQEQILLRSQSACLFPQRALRFSIDSASLPSNARSVLLKTDRQGSKTYSTFDTFQKDRNPTDLLSISSPAVIDQVACRASQGSRQQHQHSLPHRIWQISIVIRGSDRVNWSDWWCSTPVQRVDGLGRCDRESVIPTMLRTSVVNS